MDNTSSGVWQRQNDGTGWTELGPPDDYGFIQNIFGAEDALFATGARPAGKAYDYAILYKESNRFIFLKEINDALIVGAGKVKNDYYLAVKGKGLYKVSITGSTPTAELMTATPSIPTDVAGLLRAKKDFIIGISKGGLLLYIDDSGITVENTTLGGTYSGGLALMDSPEPQEGFDKLLLLGNENNSLYRQGYMELRFKSSDKTYQTPPRLPGEAQPSSINDYKQYDSSLRREPVTALWVLPKTGEDPQVIFAATTNQGLYSYRSRSDGGWQWNHEE
jgi:hypothetical protein